MASAPPPPTGSVRLPPLTLMPTGSGTPPPVPPPPPPFVLRPTYYKFWGKSCPVITAGRMWYLQQQGKLPGADIHTTRRETVRKATLNVADPANLFFPCMQAFIQEMADARFQGSIQIDDAQLQKARESLLVLDPDKVNSDWGLKKQVVDDSGNPGLRGILDLTTQMQYDRHDTDAVISHNALSNGETSVLQKMNFPGMFSGWWAGKYLFGNESSYRGEMLAVTERMLFYKGVKFDWPEQNNSQPDQHKFSYKGPDSNGVTIEYFTGEVVNKADDKKPSYNLQLKLNPNLMPDDYATALRHTLLFASQYTQSSGLNVLPVSKWSTNPINNIILLTMAVGEFHLNIPAHLLTPAEKQKTIDAIINTYGDPDPAKNTGDWQRAKGLIELWEFASKMAELPQPDFVNGKQRLNENLLANPAYGTFSHPDPTKAGTYRIVLNQNEPIIEGKRNAAGTITLEEALRLKVEQAIKDGYIVGNNIQYIAPSLRH